MQRFAVAILMSMITLAPGCAGKKQRDSQRAAKCPPPAKRLAAQAGKPCAVMMKLKQSGLGWGQLRKAAALAQSLDKLTFEQAVTLVREKKGWGPIRRELGLPPGPPPWSMGRVDDAK
jgi:hypothetical protein